MLDWRMPRAYVPTGRRMRGLDGLPEASTYVAATTIAPEDIETRRAPSPVVVSLPKPAPRPAPPPSGPIFLPAQPMVMVEYVKQAPALKIPEDYAATGAAWASELAYARYRAASSAMAETERQKEAAGRAAHMMAQASAMQRRPASETREATSEEQSRTLEYASISNLPYGEDRIQAMLVYAQKHAPWGWRIAYEIAMKEAPFPATAAEAAAAYASRPDSESLDQKKAFARKAAEKAGAEIGRAIGPGLEQAYSSISASFQALPGQAQRSYGSAASQVFEMLTGGFPSKTDFIVRGAKSEISKRKITASDVNSFKSGWGQFSTDFARRAIAKVQRESPEDQRQRKRYERNQMDLDEKLKYKEDLALKTAARNEAIQELGAPVHEIQAASDSKIMSTDKNIGESEEAKAVIAWNLVNKLNAIIELAAIKYLEKKYGSEVASAVRVETPREAAGAPSPLMPVAVVSAPEPTPIPPPTPEKPKKYSDLTKAERAALQREALMRSQAGEIF